MAITREYLIQKLASFVTENGRVPKVKEFGHYGIIHKFFGSYTAFLESQGFGKTRIIAHPTKSELEKRLHEFVNKNKRTPKSVEFGFASHVYKYYGSYINFIKVCGYASLYLDSRNHPASKEALIDKLNVFVTRHGRTPTSTEFGQNTTIVRKFGSYNAFLHSQGFPPNTPGRKTQPLEEKLAKKLDAFIAEHKRIPQPNEFKHYKAIRTTYDTYGAFLRAHGHTLPPSEVAPKKKTKKDTSKAKKNNPQRDNRSRLTNKPSRSSKTGVRGVTINKKSNHYEARIDCQGKRYYLGTFKTLEEAAEARKAAEEKYFAPLLKEYTESLQQDETC
ncbi:homing endonuclease associated repeat-containing protein [Enterococcus gilvus]|uniref:homing endonuclease associated repeat-containing protein n=1 Tax=Enterococcus gilvus TaxID=160453 RepID=UPI0028D6453F|nr:AP2 domain-containing protein [Enterococcus gilvus]